MTRGASVTKRAVQLLGRLFIGAALLGLLPAARLPIDQPVKAAAGSQSALALHPSTTGMTGDIILAKLLEHNRLREARLRQFRRRALIESKMTKARCARKFRWCCTIARIAPKSSRLFLKRGQG